MSEQIEPGEGNDKMRAAFEKWADKQCMSLTRVSWKDGSVSEYAYTATFDAWQVWQAAWREAQIAADAINEK